MTDNIYFFPQSNNGMVSFAHKAAKLQLFYVKWKQPDIKTTAQQRKGQLCMCWFHHPYLDANRELCLAAQLKPFLLKDFQIQQPPKCIKSN